MEAKEARNLCMVYCKDEIQETLIEIKEAAKNRQNSLVKFIQGGTIDKLEDLGYNINLESYPISGERTALKITISW